MEDKFELIEKYLMNELSVREQVEFEEELRADPELMKEFLLRKKINAAILEEDVMNMRDKLNGIMGAENPAKTKLSRKLYIYSAVAAAIVLLIVIANTYFLPFEALSSKGAFNQYYSTYPAVMSFRSPVSQNEIESILYRAFNYYDESEYGEASKYFKEVIEKDKTNYMSQFYLSVCKIETNDLKEAEEYLTDLTLRNNHIFWEQSHWYLAMAYLKQSKVDSAKSVLNKIVQENMSQRAEAELVLSSLE